MPGIKIFILLFTFLITSFAGHAGAKDKMGKTILAIFAHPDDETAVGPILAKYAENNKVYLVLATNGQYGVREHAGIPEGDSLAQVRKLETLCSCKALGIEPPIFLGFDDLLGSKDGMREYFRQTIELKEKLRQIIEEINPDVIITFGPDGDTGHFDHRGIYAITTEVILREGWYEKYPLYLVGWPMSVLVTIPLHSQLNYVDDQYLNVKIKYDESHREKHFESIRCHQSQWSEAEMNEWIETEKVDTTYTAYFRRFVIDSNIINDLFD